MDGKQERNTVRPQRKRLAHPTPVERHNKPVVVFVTLTIEPRGDYLANQGFLEAFVQACGDADAWRVGYYLVMPDHVHLFCSPALWPTVVLKRRVTIRLAESQGQSNGVGGSRLAGTLAPQETRAWCWQSDFWDTQIRSGEHYHEKWEYVRQNPVRARLVANAEEWPWQGVLHVLRW